MRRGGAAVHASAAGGRAVSARGRDGRPAGRQRLAGRAERKRRKKRRARQQGAARIRKTVKSCRRCARRTLFLRGRRCAWRPPHDRPSVAQRVGTADIVVNRVKMTRRRAHEVSEVFESTCKARAALWQVIRRAPSLRFPNGHFWRRTAAANTIASASQEIIIVEPPMGAAKGKMRSPVKARIASSAENSAAPASMTKPTTMSARAERRRDPCVRRDPERRGGVQQEKDGAPRREFPAARMHAQGREPHAGRAHERGDAGENEGRTGHRRLRHTGSLASNAGPHDGACQDEGDPRSFGRPCVLSRG